MENNKFKALQDSDLSSEEQSKSEENKPVGFSDLSEFLNQTDQQIAVLGDVIYHHPSTMKKQTLEVGFYRMDAAKLLTGHQGKENGSGKKPFLAGINTFDSKLPRLLQAAAQDDPFADQLLLDIESKIEELREMVEHQNQQVMVQIQQHLNYNNARVVHDKNNFVATYEPNYRTELAHKLLWAAKDIDKLLVSLDIATNAAIVAKKIGSTYKHQSIRAFRRIIHMCDNFAHTSITRIDIAHNTARCKSAFDRNVKVGLSPEVLLCEVRADSAPRIATRQFDSVEDIKEKLVEFINKRSAMVEAAESANREFEKVS